MSDYVPRRLERLEAFVDWAQVHQQDQVCNDVVPALGRAVAAAAELAQEWRRQAALNETEAARGDLYDVATLNMLQAAALDLNTRAQALEDALARPLRSDRLDRLIGSTQ